MQVRRLAAAHPERLGYGTVPYREGISFATASDRGPASSYVHRTGTHRTAKRVCCGIAPVRDTSKNGTIPFIIRSAGDRRCLRHAIIHLSDPMRYLRLAGLFLPMMAASLVTPVRAQEMPGQSMQPKLLIHGHYCGPGNDGPGVAPVDALDAACMRHDACMPDVGLPSCGCHRRLKRDASLIAASPRHSEDIRMLAGLIARGSDLMMCREDHAARSN